MFIGLSVFFLFMGLLWLLSAYKKIYKTHPSASLLPLPTHAGTVVYKTEGGSTSYLLITAKNKPGTWVLPKGYIEKNEAPKKAALRELMEEAGVKGAVIKNLGMVERKKAGSEKMVTQYFLVEAQSKGKKDVLVKGRLGKWLPLREAIALAAHADTKEILSRVVE